MFIEGNGEMCKGENQRHLHHTPGEQMLAFWCQHESVLALQREQYKESHCLERKKKKKKQGCKKIGKWVSAPPPEGGSAGVCGGQ